MRERATKRAEELYKPKKISKHKFQPAEIEIKLSDEIPSSLRTLRPEGNLIVDRMKSFEKRNIVEPRKKTLRKKRWVKKIFKRSYKKGVEDILNAGPKQLMRDD